MPNQDAECLIRMPVGVVIDDNCNHKTDGMINNQANCYMLALPLGSRSTYPCCLYLSCLGAKDTMQSLWETFVGLLKKRCCHEKCCGRVGCAAV